MIRVSPCELPRSWPGGKRSSPRHFAPRSEARKSAALPTPPVPMTMRSNAVTSLAEELPCLRGSRQVELRVDGERLLEERLARGGVTCGEEDRALMEEELRVERAEFGRGLDRRLRLGDLAVPV